MEELSLKKCCGSAAELERYLSVKAQTHNYYKTYSTSDRIRSWMDTDCFYLDDGSRWNDVHDRTTFNREENDVRRFGRCFSFSRSESVAMWMLYGGMEKKGAMVEFTESAMRELVEKISYVELGTWVEGAFRSAVTLQREDFDLILKDILYADTHDVNTVYIRRSEESCKDASPEVISQLRDCVKSVAWSYENECRLILTVKKDVLPAGQKITSVRVPLNGLLKDGKRVRIFCSPNFRGEKPFRTSRITGEVDWDLCSGCKGPSDDKNVTHSENTENSVPATV